MVPSSWIVTKPFWVTLVGIPYHLMTYGIVNSLCKIFGFIEEFTKYGSIRNGLTRIRVKIKECRVKLLPHLIPLVDIGGVVYPLQFVLEDLGMEVEKSFFATIDVHARTRVGR